MAISYVGAGSPAFGTGSVTPSLPAGIAADDLLILSVETANEAVTTPSGWLQTNSSPIGTGTAGSTTATRLTLFYRIATSSESAPTVADPGNHAYASIRAFRGVDTTSPINATSGVASASSTSVSMNQVTTTVADAMIVWYVANATDSTATQHSGTWTNAGLTGIADAGGDNTNQGNGGGLSVGYGFKTVAGATGTTSTTLGTASVQAKITLALNPFVAAVFGASQAAYRFYEDGTESGSTAIASQDTNITRDVTSDSNLQLRVRLQEINGANGHFADDYQLQYSLNGGTYTNVGTGAVIGYNSASLAADADILLRRLGTGTGSYVAGRVSENGLVENHTLTASNHTEHLFSLTLVSSALTGTDTLDFRVLRGGDTTSMTYTVIPRITVADPAPTISANTADATDFTTATPTLEFTGTDAQSDSLRYNVQVANTGFSSTSTYYFDGSDASATDPAGVWNSDEDTFNGDLLTGASTSNSTLGTTSSRFLMAEGTNAPSSGGTISQVRMQIYTQGSDEGSIVSVTAYTDGLSENLGTATGFDSFTANYGSFVTLTTPTGGWTWAKLQALECKAYITTTGFGGATLIRRIDLEVTSIPLLNKISGTDSGFLNTVTGGDTDPFNSGEKISYTVQSAEALPAGTYYWRARAIDPSGTNTYGDWTATRSFSILDDYISVVGTSYLSPASRSSLDVTIPTGNLSGHLAVVDLVLEANRTLTVPSGFTLLGSTEFSGGQYIKSSTYYKVLTGTESGTWSFSWSGGATFSGATVAIYRNADAPTEYTGVVGDGTNTTAAPPISATIAGTGWVVYGSDAWNGTTTNSIPAGYSLIVRDHAPGSLAFSNIGYVTTTGGATGTLNATFSTASTGKIATLYLIPGAGSTGGGTTGQVKVYNGSSFVAKPVKVWNGSAWVTKPVKRYNGSTWVTTPY